MKSLENLPRAFLPFNNWVVWKEEARHNKLTKIPYQATDSLLHAKATSPDTWNKLSAAVKKAYMIASPDNKSGVGFVITGETGLVCIDLDDPAKLGPNEKNARILHQALLEEFAGTYIERSPSGTGYHIWMFATLPHDRQSVSLKAKAGVEIYSGARFMTMTGEHVGRAYEITNQQAVLDRLIDHLVVINGGTLPGAAVLNDEQLESDTSHGRRNDLTDDQVVQLAIRNNSKFLEFYNAVAVTDRSEFAKPVAGDLDKICASADQIYRIMAASPIGRCYEPAELERKLFKYWLPEAKASNQPILEAREKGKELQAQLIKAETERQAAVERAPKVPTGTFDPPFKNAPQNIPEYITDYPPGMIGVLAQEIRERATMRASKDFAVAAALSLFAGMSGHAYSFEKVNGALYMLMLGKSGQGKEAPAEARDKLVQQLRGAGVHPDMLSGLSGPSKITSPQGLHKRLERDKNLLAILGEATVWLSDLAASKQGIWIEIKRFILDLYGKQGKGRTMSPAEVLNKDNKLATILGPAATLLMEGEPSVYTDLLGFDPYTSSGLCARIIHVEGNPDDMPEKNYGDTSFSDYVVQNLAQVVGFWTQKRNDQNALMAAHEKGMAPMGVNPETAWVSVGMTDDCLIHHRKFDREIDFFMNKHEGKIGDMYNRLIANTLRIAVNLAVGINPYSPVIDLDLYHWAQAFVLRGLYKIGGRVDRGDVGTGDFRVKAMILKKVEEWKGMSKQERIVAIRDKARIKDAGRREYLASFPGAPWAAIQPQVAVYAQRHLNAERAGQTVLNILQAMDATGEVVLHRGYSYGGAVSKGLIVGWVDE